jgi:hypothetical protein
MLAWHTGNLLAAADVGLDLIRIERHGGYMGDATINGG